MWHSKTVYRRSKGNTMTQRKRTKGKQWSRNSTQKQNKKQKKNEQHEPHLKRSNLRKGKHWYLPSCYPR